jgi:4-amino-4-deoxy-L-arabinose transferase-like glycosyltransferase
LAWFLIVPPPYANSNLRPEDNRVRRGLLLLKAFPEVVPDTPLHDSFLGKGIEELSHVENLPQRVPILLTAGLIAAAAIGMGDLVLRGLRMESGLGFGERVALDFGLGAGLLGGITLLAGRMGWLNPLLFRVGLALLAAAGLSTSRIWRASWLKIDLTSCLLGLVIAPFLLVMILGSMLPTIDYDVLEYHLQGPKEYYQAGRIAFLPHNVYTNMPFGVEMLHLLAMEVMGDWWWGGLAGQLLVALFAPAAATLIAATASRVGSARAAWVAAIVYLSTPWIYRLAVLAYVEGPLCYYHAALIWATFRGWADRSMPRWRFWGLLGLLAGCAMGCKYPALVSAVIPLGALAVIDCIRSRSLGSLVCYAAGWSIVIGPWLTKNVIDTGNPVYPLANSIFHGRHWDRAREVQWTGAHARQPITPWWLATSLLDVAGRSDFQSPLYVALAPLALLRAGSRRQAIALWIVVVYLFLTWWVLTHRVDRFWLPLLPPFAILAGLGADWTRGRAWSIVLGTIMLIALVANLTYISTALAGLNEWTADLAYLHRDIPRRWNAPLARLDTELPADAHPLLVGQAAVYHIEHKVTYNTVFNPEIIELLASGKSDESFRAALHARNLTHIYVDWKEIQRARQPGGYGFTDFVQPSRFAHWVAAGVLDGPVHLGAEQELYVIK